MNSDFRDLAKHDFSGLGRADDGDETHSENSDVDDADILARLLHRRPKRSCAKKRRVGSKVGGKLKLELKRRAVPKGAARPDLPEATTLLPAATAPQPDAAAPPPAHEGGSFQ